MVVAPASDATNFLSYDHIVADPRVHLEFLDAREAWPPLLRPGVLAGLGAYDAWEARVLQAFLQPVVDGRPLAETMGDLVRWTDWVRDWRPADGALEVRVGRPWRARRGPAAHSPGPTAISNLLDDLISRVPAPWRPASWPAGLTDAFLDGKPLSRRQAEAAVGRYLATRLIGSWVAYQGSGFRSVVASLVSAHAVVTEALLRTTEAAPTFGHLTTALRATDWLLLHLLDRQEWACWCAATETVVEAGRLLELVNSASASFDALPWPPEVV